MFAYSFFNIEIFKENTRPLCSKYTASLSEIDRISINRIVHFYDSTKSVEKYRFSLNIDPSGYGNTSGDIVESVSVNSTLENALGPELCPFLFWKHIACPPILNIPFLSMPYYGS